MRNATAATGSPPAPEANASARPVRWHGLPPVASAQTVVLVLGSFPGAASLRAQQYYGHPQNHFWKILQALWPQHALPPAGSDGYAARCDWLLERGLGLWDVYESCEREGSLDTSIRNARLNDFARLHGRCPRLAVVAHNGGESFKHAKGVLRNLSAPLLSVTSTPSTRPIPLTHDEGEARSGHPGAGLIRAVRLPSTSPANASWSFDRKLAAWAELMSAYELL